MANKIVYPITCNSCGHPRLPVPSFRCVYTCGSYYENGDLIRSPLCQLKNEAAWVEHIESRLIEANKKISRLLTVLAKIRDQDYRGNRSVESQIAAKALEEIE